MGNKKPIEVEAQGVDTDLPEISSTTPALVPVVAERPTYIDLLKFTAKDESLATIKKKRVEYDLVKIDGVEDKEGYAKVKANMEQMRDDRRAFENAAYNNVIDPLKKALKEYADDIDAVVEEFKAGEKAERDKKDFIDTEKKRIKLEAEEAKERAALLRVNELNVLGAQFNGSVYTFAFDDSLMINVLQLKDFEQAEFDEFIEEVKVAYEVEQRRLADEKLRQEEEAEEKRKADLLITQQAEKNEQVSTELNIKRTKLRSKELKLLGYEFEVYHECYINDPMPQISVFRVENDSDEIWDELIYDLEHFTPAQEPLVIEIESFKQVSPGGPEIEQVAAVEQAPVDESLPLSLEFYQEDVVDFGDRVTSFEQFKEWVAEDIQDYVSDNTPFARHGVGAETRCYRFEGKCYEITLTNISWNRHDKQYYYIDMFESPNLDIKEVRPQDGKRPILSVDVLMEFTLDIPYTDFNITPKMFIRVYPDEYADKALACIDSIASQGKVQTLNWVILKK